MNVFNPYKVLGVSDNATKDECKKAYRKLSVKYHPDNGGSLDDFHNITKAWKMIENNTYKPITIQRKVLVHKSLLSFV